jgi:membrane glycosyltransferase
MENKKKCIIYLVVLDILLVSFIVFLYLYAKNIDNNSLSAIIEENDGNTTIYIPSRFMNKIWLYLCSLILITLDTIISTVILVIEYIKNKKIKLIHRIIITIISNIIISLLLFPTVILFVVIINILIIILFLVKYLFDKKYK